MGKASEKVIGERVFQFSRRRYGNTTYTWVSVKVGDRFVSLGDPWPCVVPKASEVIAAADAVLREGEDEDAVAV